MANRYCIPGVRLGIQIHVPSGFVRNGEIVEGRRHGRTLATGLRAREMPRNPRARILTGRTKGARRGARASAQSSTLDGRGHAKRACDISASASSYLEMSEYR